MHLLLSTVSLSLICRCVSDFVWRLLGERQCQYFVHSLTRLELAKLHGENYIYYPLGSTSLSVLFSKLMEDVLFSSALICTQTHMDFLSMSQEIMLSCYFDLSLASPSCSPDVSKSKAPQFRDLKLYEKWVSGRSPEAVRRNASTKCCDLERDDSWVLLEWAV